MANHRYKPTDPFYRSFNSILDQWLIPNLIEAFFDNRFSNIYPF